VEKYGTDVRANLVAEETRLMNEMAAAMSSSEKKASQISKLELQIVEIRSAISEFDRTKE